MFEPSSSNITFAQRRPNVFDVDPTVYKWFYTNLLCLLGGHTPISLFSHLCPLQRDALDKRLLLGFTFCKTNGERHLGSDGPELDPGSDHARIIPRRRLGHLETEKFKPPKHRFYFQNKMF